MPDENLSAGEAKSKSTRGAGGDAEENRVIAAVGYLGILFLIPLLAKRDSAFAQYHAKQGLALFVFTMIVYFASWVPIISWIIVPVGYLAGIILLVIGLVNSLAGQTKPLPVIGRYAENLKI